MREVRDSNTAVSVSGEVSERKGENNEERDQMKSIYEERQNKDMMKLSNKEKKKRR